MVVVTMIGGEKETTNTAQYGDAIFSGVSGEQYVIPGKKLEKLYTGMPGGILFPEQSERMVARVPRGTSNFQFKAAWGEDMLAKAGDLIVADGIEHGQFYRIAQDEFSQSYNQLPSEIAADAKIDNLTSKSAQIGKDGRGDRAQVL